MGIEVGREMAASPSAVAAIMFDPRRDAEWMENTHLAEVPHRDWLAVGAQVRHEGMVLGRKMAWTTRVEEHVPDRLLRFELVEGPTGEISYSIEPTDAGSYVGIHDRRKFDFTAMSWLVRQQLSDDLDRLARLVEGAGTSAEPEFEPASELDPWGSEPD